MNSGGGQSQGGDTIMPNDVYKPKDLSQLQAMNMPPPQQQFQMQPPRQNPPQQAAPEWGQPAQGYQQRPTQYQGY